MDKKEQILYLRNRKSEKRWTFEEIGGFYGVSRQRVHQVANNSHWGGKPGRPRIHQVVGKYNEPPWEV